MLRKAGLQAARNLRSIVERPGRRTCRCGRGQDFVGSGSHIAIFFQVAAGPVLALVAHALIPESIHEGRSLTVLPTVAGFLFALWLALGQSLL